MINLEISKRLASRGYYYAPDPSSQQVCTIGGNVAENSGGAHCLKYGFTTNHVLGATIVLPDGEIVELGGPVADPIGYDLRGALVGSEGRSRPREIPTGRSREIPTGEIPTEVSLRVRFSANQRLVSGRRTAGQARRPHATCPIQWRRGLGRCVRTL